MNIKRYRKEHTWLAARSKLITSSDVPVILGIGYGKSPLELYYEKRGELVGGNGKPDMRVRFAVGHALEPLTAQLAEEELGIKTVDPGEYAIVTNSDIPWAGATVDRFMAKPYRWPEQPDIVGVLELKTVHPSFKHNWDEGPDRYALVQLLYQMQVCGLDHGAAAALLGLSEFTVHELDLSQCQGLADDIMDAAWAFHHRLTTGDPPAANYLAIPALKRRFPVSDPARTVVLPPTSGWVTRQSRYQELSEQRAGLKAQLKEVEQELGDIEAEVMQVMGEAEALEVGNLKATWKTSHRNGYTVEPKDIRTLRIKIEEESQ